MKLGENILEYWKYYAIIVALISLGGWIYNQGGSNVQLENRIFTTEEMRYETEKYMNQKPSPAEEQRALILDSINNVSAIKSRAKRDSLYLLEIKARKITDSINKLNADQLYQIKEEFKIIKEELKRINN